MEISDSDVHREMMNILADASEDPNARIYAGWVLQRVANLNDPHIFQELLKLLEKESPYSNFNLASEVLKHFEPSDKEVHKNLLQILDDLENPLRKKLIPVISMNPFALADLEIQKALARAVVDKGFDVSNGAEEGLLGAGAVNIETARELLKHLESHRAARILMSMHLSDPELHRILVKSLKSEDEGVRENAADVLASVREPDSLILQALVGALRDPSQSVQEHAASALGKLGLYTTEVKEGLLEAVDHSDGMALAAIAQSLGKMGLLGNSAATLKLLNALGERPFFLSPAAGILNAVSESHPTDPKIHQKMASLIDQFGTILGQLVVQYFKKNSVDPALVESKVIKFLDDPVPDKRLIAARILKNLRLDPMSQKYLDRKILKSIIPILNDFAPGNRVWASKLIRQIEARNPDLLDFEQHQALFHLKNYYADFTAGCQKDPIQYVLDPHHYEELQDALLKLGVHFENHSNGF
jgi:HEAT repeat protein